MCAYVVVKQTYSRIINATCLFSNVSQMLTGRLSIKPPLSNDSGPSLLRPSLFPCRVPEGRWRRGELSLFLLLSLSLCIPPPSPPAAPSHSEGLPFPPPAVTWTEGNCWPHVCSSGAALCVWFQPSRGLISSLSAL